MNKRDKQSGSAYLGLIVVMAVAFFFLLMVSMRGWGYMGYGGYHRGPSFWYMGGPNAPLQAPESIAGMRAVIDRLTPADSGTFWTHEGQQMPW